MTLRIRKRYLAVLCLGCIVLCVIAVVYCVIAPSAESLAVARIERAGGRLLCNGRGPRFLGMCEIQGIIFSGPQLDDNELTSLMPSIKEFPTITTLEFNGTSVTDVGIVELRRMDSLQQLIFHDARITNRSVLHLNSIKHLLRVAISRTNIDAAGVLLLFDSPSLMEIWIDPGAMDCLIGTHDLPNGRTIHVFGGAAAFGQQLSAE